MERGWVTASAGRAGPVARGARDMSPLSPRCAPCSTLSFSVRVLGAPLQDPGHFGVIDSVRWGLRVRPP